MPVNQLLGEFTLDEFRSDFEFMDLVVRSVRNVRLPLRSSDMDGSYACAPLPTLVHSRCDPDMLRTRYKLPVVKRSLIRIRKPSNLSD